MNRLLTKQSAGRKDSGRLLKKRDTENGFKVARNPFAKQKTIEKIFSEDFLDEETEPPPSLNEEHNSANARSAPGSLDYFMPEAEINDAVYQQMTDDYSLLEEEEEEMGNNPGMFLKLASTKYEEDNPVELMLERGGLMTLNTWLNYYQSQTGRTTIFDD